VTTITPFSSLAPQLDVFSSVPTRGDPRSGKARDRSEDEVSNPEPLRYLAQEISRSVLDVNERLASQNKELTIHVDYQMGLAVIRIVDRSTNEIVLEIPTELSRSLVKRIERTTGLLADRVD